MKAITHRIYGGSEVLQLEEGRNPRPNDGQALVRVRAAALNPYDMHFLHGTPYLVRLSTGLRKPKFTGIGVDFSGFVESVGKNVTGFKPGDAVFGGHHGARRIPGHSRAAADEQAGQHQLRAGGRSEHRGKDRAAGAAQ